jgi:hypothetical protein
MAGNWTLQPINSPTDPLKLLRVAKNCNIGSGAWSDSLTGTIKEVRCANSNYVEIIVDTRDERYIPPPAFRKQSESDEALPVIDAELMAIARIQEALRPLSQNQLERILRYLTDKETKP